MSIHQLVYISEAVSDIKYLDIRGMLTASRIRNFRNNITGVLFFRDGYFIQLLEGEYTKVHGSLERIKLDPRHHHVRVMAEGTSSERAFENWYMAFIDADTCGADEEALEKLFSFGDQESVSSNQVLEIVKSFTSHCACHL